MGMLVAGIDCSTQATKAVVVDAADGELVAQGRAAHSVTGAGGVRESDPEAWWTALGEALAQTGRAADVAAIAVAGQQHGLVLLDAGGRVLRPAPLWHDMTSAPQAAALIEDLGGSERWARRVGLVPTASYTVAKWAHVRACEPAVAAAVGAVRLPHDFLTERLCGRAVTDRGDASGTGWLASGEDAYALDVLALERVALDPAWLPELLTGSAPAGTASPRAVAELGLAPDAVVAAGTGDNMAAAVGLGLASGVPALSLGTSGTVFAVTERPAVDPTGVVAGFADAGIRHLPLGCVVNATLAVDRVASWLRLEREDVEPAGEVVALPYLDGERAPVYPHAAGTITGLRHATTRAQILQATYDAIVEAMLDALDALVAATGGVDSDAPLVLLGGGAGGAAWRETVLRLSGRAVELPSDGELVAQGAAALAAASLSGEGPYEVARRWRARRPARLLEPVARDDERLERIRRVRTTLHAFNAAG